MGKIFIGSSDWLESWSFEGCVAVEVVVVLLTLVLRKPRLMMGLVLVDDEGKEQTGSGKKPLTEVAFI